ncbi:1,4-beta-xylanase, partial [Sphingomonas sp. JC676]|nr:1,4-beta-xylanase [Sphingomonas sp. JC676]MBC9035226.1 1,4-beta-xylanase [Sphingomonas sp. JC676]
GGGNYKPTEDKNKYVAKLLPQVFDWARSVDPIQPLTSGVWLGDHWDDLTKVDAVEKTQITQSDVISFHDYSWPETFEKRAMQMLGYGRPVWCTEYMARGNGSTFDGSLPIGKRLNIAMFNWGFVDGKTQTRLPWDSWKKPYTSDEPTIWFHEVFRADGKPYRQAEADLIKRLSAAPKGTVPAGR